MPFLTTDLRDALRDRFRAAFGERLHRLILYGSYARRDAAEDSDIDVLVVLEGEVGSEEETRAHAVEADLFGPGLSPLSLLMVSADEFATRNLPLFRNVRAEGELLFPENTPAAKHHLRTHSYPSHDTASGMRPESETYLERARARLDTVRDVPETGGDITLVVSAAYHAMFLTATAALNEADLAAKSHKGTITLFSKHYVKKGPLDGYYGSLLSEAQGKRIDADYARNPSFSPEDAEQWPHRAEDFVDTVEAMLLDATPDDDSAS